MANPDISSQVANGMVKAVLALALLAVCIGVLIWGYGQYRANREATAWYHTP